MKKTTNIFNIMMFISILCLSLLPLMAEENEQQSITELSDVETTVAGDTIEVYEESIPEFSTVLPVASTPFPQLPSVQIGDTVTTEVVVDTSSVSEKVDIFLEGKIGAGWPGCFIGDFTVYQNSGKSPFSLNFSHESFNGYGLHKPENGYSDSTTLLAGKKRFAVTDIFTIDVNAGYITSDYGLQDNSPIFHSLKRQRFNGDVSFDFSMPRGFSAGLGMNGDWYNSYGVVKSTVDDNISTSKILFTAIPDVHLAWQYGSFEVSGFGKYNFVGLWTSDNTTVNRGDIGVDAVWTYEPVTALGGVLSKFRVLGDVNVIIADSRTIVPFSINTTADLVIPFATSLATVDVSGGIKSVQTPVSELQMKYPYVAFDALPVEESDTFVDGTIRIPFGSVAVSSLSINYAQTVWNNGVLRPDYSKINDDTKFFGVSRYNRAKLSSDVGIDIQTGIVGFGFGWYSSWLDRVEGEQLDSIYTDISVHSKNGRFGASTDIVFCFEEGYIPELGLSAFYRINNSFSLEIEVNDMIQLLSGNDRTAVAPYITRGGNAILAIKLFF